MRITLSDRISSFFARDKRTFWWKHFTDDEKQLRRMNVWELAKVINEETNPEKRIVAEHFMNVRLAKIQATASWGSGVIGFVGAIIGAAISVALTMSIQSPKEAPCAAERASEKQAVAAPVQHTEKPIEQSLENTKTNNVVEVGRLPHGAVNGPRDGAKTKQPASPAKP